MSSKLFSQLQQAIEYFEQLNEQERKNSILLQVDHPSNSNKSIKKYKVNTYENVYRELLSASYPLSYYETYNFLVDKVRQPTKFFIDYDFKVVHEDIVVTEEFIRATCIKNMVSIIQQLKILFDNPDLEFSILKSYPDCNSTGIVLSYHIIVHSIYFEKCSNMKAFVKTHLMNLISKELSAIKDKIIDLVVYSESHRCLRLMWNTKLNENRALELLNTHDFMYNYKETPIPKTEITFQEFCNTCITKIEPNCKLYTFIKSTPEEIVSIYTSEEDKLWSVLELLDESRYTDYNKWIGIGVILKDMENVKNQYYDLWERFSKKSNQFNQQECIKKWNDLDHFKSIDSEGRPRVRNTVNNLYACAKRDNPIAFIELTQNILKHDLSVLQDNNYAISDFVYSRYPDIFKCIDTRKKIWYFYSAKNHKWILQSKDEDLVRHLKVIYNEISQHCEVSKDKLSKQQLVKLKSVLRTLQKENIPSYLHNNYYDKDFTSILNQNINLMGFDNGVFDLDAWVFRDGQPSDNISITTKYNYDPNYVECVNSILNRTASCMILSEEYKLCVKLIDALRLIFPNPSVFDYVMTIISICLSGEQHQLWFIWTGEGANGKSLLVNLCQSTFGEYSACIRPQFLTRPYPDGENATPALVKLQYARFVDVQEPESTEKLQGSKIKGITGDSTISVRALYGAETSYHPQFHLFLCTNDIPEYAAEPNYSEQRRTKVIEFTQTFIMDNKALGPNQHRADKQFGKDSKNGKYNMAFMGVLLHYYQRFKHNNKIIPYCHEIEQATNTYLSIQNSLTSFITDNILRDEDATMTKQELLNRYNLYRSENKDFALKFKTKDKFIHKIEKSLKIDWSNVSEGQVCYGIGLKAFRFG